MAHRYRKELDPDERLALGHHLFGSAGPEPIGLEREITGFLNDAIDLLRCAAVISSDSYRHMSRIEINRISEKYNLNRRNEQDQRDGRSIVDEMQDFDAGHGQHPRNASTDAAPTNGDSHSVLREHRLEDASTASSRRIATRAIPAWLMLATRHRLSSAAASATTRRPGP